MDEPEREPTPTEWAESVLTTLHEDSRSYFVLKLLIDDEVEDSAALHALGVLISTNRLDSTQRAIAESLLNSGGFGRCTEAARDLLTENRPL